MNGETTTTACLCQTVDRATGTLRRLLHRIVLLCAATSYLLSLPLQVMFPEFLPLGETQVKGGPLLLPFVLSLSVLKPNYGKRTLLGIGVPHSGPRWKILFKKSEIGQGALVIVQDD